MVFICFYFLILYAFVEQSVFSVRIAVAKLLLCDFFFAFTPVSPLSMLSFYMRCISSVLCRLTVFIHLSYLSFNYSFSPLFIFMSVFNFYRFSLQLSCSFAFVFICMYFICIVVLVFYSQFMSPFILNPLSFKCLFSSIQRPLLLSFLILTNQYVFALRELEILLHFVSFHSFFLNNILLFLFSLVCLVAAITLLFLPRFYFYLLSSLSSLSQYYYILFYPKL